MASGALRCAAELMTRQMQVRYGCSQAAASSQAPTRPRSWRSPTPSSCPCGTPSPPAEYAHATRALEAVPTIAQPLGTDRFVLSEGPVWDPNSASLTWVDIEAGRILTARWADGALATPASIDVGEYVGCAIPLNAGRMLAALTRQLGVIEADGTILRSQELIQAGTRFNDGKIDPQGRLVVGTMSLQGPDEAQLLLRLEADGAITVLDDNLLLANGLGWSPDGRTLYSVSYTHLRAHETD